MAETTQSALDENPQTIVETSTPETSFNTNASIYIGQVDYSSTPEELTEFFSTAGNVVQVTIPGHPLKPQGYAYLEFSDESSVQNAIESLNGSDFKGRALKVFYPSTIIFSLNDSKRRNP
mmetsp:Transcript_12014/g.14544  ORF Transcript_12014/g.14544 Transcript_12014/m.14544 type:complete len:120 (-) Transcript_12014:195-554(-)